MKPFLLLDVEYFGLSGSLNFHCDRLTHCHSKCNCKRRSRSRSSTSCRSSSNWTRSNYRSKSILVMSRWSGTRNSGYCGSLLLSFGLNKGSSLNHVANFLKILTPPPPQMAKHDHLMNPPYGHMDFSHTPLFLKNKINFKKVVTKLKKNFYSFFKRLGNCRVGNLKHNFFCQKCLKKL